MSECNCEACEARRRAQDIQNNQGPQAMMQAQLQQNMSQTYPQWLQNWRNAAAMLKPKPKPVLTLIQGGLSEEKKG